MARDHSEHAWHTSAAARRQRPARQSARSSVGRSRVLRGLEQLTTVAATAFVFVGLLGLLQMLGCHRAVLSVRAVAEYGTGDGFAFELPSNVYAARDARALRSLGVDVGLTQEDVSTTNLREFLENFGTRNEHARRLKQTVIVYLSLFGGIREDGRGVLLQSDSDARAPESYLTIDQFAIAVEDAFRDSTDHVLLLLDVVPAPRNWWSGFLADAPMAELQARLQPVVESNPQLAILTSCGPHEDAWASPWLGPDSQGQSVFAHYVGRALAGEADVRELDQQRGGDSRLMLDEFAAYLQTRVNSWVRQNRDPRGQHPLLIVHPDPQHWSEQPVVTIPNVSRFAANARGDGEDAEERSNAQAGRERFAAVQTELFNAWTAFKQTESELLQRQPAQWRVITHLLIDAEHLMRQNDVTEAARRAAEAQKRLKGSLRDELADGLQQAEAWPFINAVILKRVQQRELTAESRGRLPDTGSPEAAGAAAETLSPPDPSEWCARYMDELPPATDDEPLVRSVIRQLRTEAERAVCGPLSTLNISRQVLRDADAERRQTEDWLFVSGSIDEAFRSRARAGYLAAVDAQQLVQRGLQLRNRLYAELPELARWSAFRFHAPDRASFLRAVCEEFDRYRSESAPRVSVLERNLQKTFTEYFGSNDDPFVRAELQVLVLFEQLRSLERTLENAVISEDADVAQLREIVPLVEGQHSRVTQAVHDLRDTIRRRGQSQWNDWRQLNDLLLCPVFDPRERRLLNERLLEIESELQGETAREETAGRSEAATVHAASATEDFATEVLRWRTLWGLQVYALSDIDADVAQNYWRRWTDCAQPDDFTTLGVELQFELQDQLTQIENTMEQTAQANGTDTRSASGSAATPADPESAVASPATETLSVAQLARSRWNADRLTRCLSVADANRCYHRPMLDLRRLWFGELCLFQTERFLEDYWRTFYDGAVDNCLEIVELLAQEDDLAALSPLQARLHEQLQQRQTAQLSAGKTVVTFGQSASRPCEIELAARGDVPAGVAAVELAFSQQQQLLVGSEPEGRVPWVIRESDPAGGTQQSPQATSFTLTRLSSEDCPPSTILTAHTDVFYRGHRFTGMRQGQDNVEVYPCPSRAVQLAVAPPAGEPLANVRVEGYDIRYAILILDCSWSMGDGSRDQRYHGPKWRAATTALKDALRRLKTAAGAAKGADHQLALMVYGHRLKKLTTETRIEESPHWLVPSGLALANDYETLIELTPAAEIDLDRVESWFNYESDTPHLEPWGLTPLYGTIKRARQLLRTEGTGGTIILITDGEPKDGRGPDGNLPPRDVEMLFDDQSVQLHVVGVSLEVKDREGLQAVSDLAVNTGGSFIEARTTYELGDAIDKAMSPRPYQVQSRDSDWQSTAPLGQTVQVEPGPYQVSFPNATPVPFEVRGWQRYRFQLENDIGKLRYIPESLRESGTAGGDGLKLGYSAFLINRVKRSAEIRLTLTAAEADVIPERPDDILFEFRNLQGERVSASAIQQRLDEDALSPTWKLQFDDWPQLQRMEVTAWRWSRQAFRTLEFRSQRWTNGGGPPLDVQTNFSGGRAEVILTPAADATDRDAARQALQDIAVRLVDTRGLRTPLHFGFVRSFFDGEPELRYEFSQLPAGVSPREFRLQIVSPSQLRQAAEVTGNPQAAVSSVTATAQ